MRSKPINGVMAITLFLTIGCANAAAVAGKNTAAQSKDIVDTAVSAGTFKTLATALQQAGLIDALKAKGPFTVFAPTDGAFAALPDGTLENLLKPENRATLQRILQYHVVPGRIAADKAARLDEAPTLEGGTIKISSPWGKLRIDGAKVLKADIECSNGIIHVIDSVLQPSMKTLDAGQMLRDAVAKGVPLFNAGHHGACAQVYEQTLQQLMDSISDPALKTHMQSVLTSARHQDSATARAWTLRHGIDTMYERLMLD